MSSKIITFADVKPGQYFFNLGHMLYLKLAPHRITTESSGTPVSFNAVYVKTGELTFIDDERQGFHIKPSYKVLAKIVWNI